MDKINFSDNIRTSGRNLYLQTNTLDAEEKVVSTLFDGGRVLSKEVSATDQGISEQRRYDSIKRFHVNRKRSLEFLYEISSRVKTVRHPRSLIKLASQFLKWNLIDEAISELEYALQYDKNIAEIYILLSRAYEKRGASEEAVKILEQSVHIFPDYADLWRHLARQYQETGKMEKAYQSICKALEINVDYIEAHLYKCYLLAARQLENNMDEDSSKNNSEAFKFHLNKVVLSESYGNANLDNALRYYHNNDWEHVFEQLGLVIKHKEPVFDMGFHDYFYLQYLFGDQGKDTETVNQYVNRLETAVRKFPKFADLHNMLGIGYLIQCRLLFNKALHQFRVACQLNPLYEKAKNNLKLAENDGKGFLILLRAMLK